MGRSIFHTWWRTSGRTVYALPRRPRSWRPETGATKAAGHLPPRSGGAALRRANAPAAQRPSPPMVGVPHLSSRGRCIILGGAEPPKPPTCGFAASLFAEAQGASHLLGFALGGFALGGFAASPAGGSFCRCFARCRFARCRFARGQSPRAALRVASGQGSLLPCVERPCSSCFASSGYSVLTSVEPPFVYLPLHAPFPSPRLLHALPTTGPCPYLLTFLFPLVSLPRSFATVWPWRSCHHHRLRLRPPPRVPPRTSTSSPLPRLRILLAFPLLSVTIRFTSADVGLHAPSRTSAFTSRPALAPSLHARFLSPPERCSVTGCQVPADLAH